MMRVVFDTNILISALVIPGGSGDKAILRAIEGEDELLISKPIVDELLGVLARKFSRDAEALSRVAVWVSDIATLVSPEERIDVLKDKPDNRILECAVAGGADAIVTGDKQMLEFGQYVGIKILTLRGYLGRV